MSMMDFAETKKAIDAITTDWFIRGPRITKTTGNITPCFVESGSGGGYIGKRKALDAILEKLTQEAAQ